MELEAPWVISRGGRLGWRTTAHRWDIDRCGDNAEQISKFPPHLLHCVLCSQMTWRQAGESYLCGGLGRHSSKRWIFVSQELNFETGSNSLPPSTPPGSQTPHSGPAGWDWLWQDYPGGGYFRHRWPETWPLAPQVPQFLVPGLSGSSMIAVTQPRRVAAVSLAKRVAR